MKTLLVSDQKDFWRDIRELFKPHPQWDLICTIKGTDALNTLTVQGNICLIIIEAGLKTDHATEFAKTILEKFGERPILFIGKDDSLTDYVDQDFCSEFDFVNTILRPIEQIHFEEQLKNAAIWTQNNNFSSDIVDLQKDEFLPIRLRNFKLFNSVPFNAFMEVIPGQFVKAITKNKKYHFSTLHQLIKRNVRFLYMERSERLSFIESSIDKARSILDSPNIDTKQAISAQLIFLSSIQEYIQDIGVSDDLCDIIVEFVGKVNAVSKTMKSFNDLCKNFKFDNRDHSEQALLLFYICELVCQKLEWNSDPTRKKLGLASILHDIMIRDDELLMISNTMDPLFAAISDDKKQEFLNHPTVSSQMAHYFTGFTDVEFIIKEHHERPDGKGFPGMVQAARLTPVSCLFILNRYLVDQLLLEGLTIQGFKTSINNLPEGYTSANFKETWLALKKLIK